MEITNSTAKVHLFGSSRERAVGSSRVQREPLVLDPAFHMGHSSVGTGQSRKMTRPYLGSLPGGYCIHLLMQVQKVLAREWEPAGSITAPWGAVSIGALKTALSKPTLSLRQLLRFGSFRTDTVVLERAWP